jgi:Na+-transporting methylmalonyl-CoA/oxaloacetate decarboxylase gamma subunit
VKPTVGGTPHSMKGVALVLIVLGILALGYQGFTYVTRDKVIDIGPVEVTQEKHKTVFLPPVVGAIAVIAGVAMLLGSRKAT